MKKNYTSRIAAVCHVSESEIAAYEELFDGISVTPYPTENPDQSFILSLYELGIDTNLPFEYQDVTQHRNRLNQVVTCGRWYGVERSDSKWLNSGVASKEALDRAANNPFLDELYRHKGLTIDTQAAGDERDKYVNEEEEQDE